MNDRAAREIFADLPWQARDVIHEWLATGHDLRAALLNSNALGSGELITPRDARQQELRRMDRREASEHEASHAVAAHALGLPVTSATISAAGGGECKHAKAATKLQDAIIAVAPELWITRFRRDEFVYGAHGLKDDHRRLAAINDEVIIRQALNHCMEILRQNRAVILATADKLERDGAVFKPW
ncbi:MAG: hypothetical protein ACRDUW_16355 [Pseudonocardiaceae bacterium]